MVAKQEKNNQYRERSIMTLFLIGLAILCIGYFTYGRMVEKILGPTHQPTPALTKADGVAYVVLPR